MCLRGEILGKEEKVCWQKKEFHESWQTDDAEMIDALSCFLERRKREVLNGAKAWSDAGL